jgi:SpoIIAA-like
MPIAFQYDKATQVCEIHLSGVLRDEELRANQEKLAPHIEAGDQPRILIIVGDFVGWERGGDWTNLDFMFSHGSKISKIAFVGDKSWEDQLKMFVGAGFRNAPVGYFETEQIEVARAWLLD